MAEFPREYDFKKIEEEMSAFWDAEKIAEETIKLDESRPLFSFLEGPPTANAPPGLHHVQSRFYKDLVCRFNYMKGFSVPRKGGWDCHGLPVEVQVEKKLGLKTKKDVLNYGIGNFNELCRKDVFTFIKDWDKLTKRMAFWIDIENPYVTLTNEYIESVWWSLKELYGKKLLYEDHKVVPYCPRCETPLSSHEVALGYNDVTEDTITTKFKLKDEDRYLLAWTTTPWTTPSNIGLAVGKDIVYVVVEKEGVQYILAKAAAERYFTEPVIIQEMAGDELVGKEYVPLFDYFVGKLDKPAWRIVAADYVNTEEGTGVVHQAPAFGEEDYETIKKEGMAFVQPVDQSGRFTKEVSDFEGMFVKDADPEIIAMLEKNNALFSKEKYTHSYPFCWRCDTPLLYYALKSWFVKVTAAKERLIELNQQIKWYPEHIRDGRFGEWLRNVKDWALSRNKFWGTPLPIWKCSCGKTTAIGSREELEAASERDIKELDLHKPAIDEITIDCSCGKKMNRVPYVIDTWYDSGAAAFAQLHYPFENKALFRKLFPYSFITESIDQTRGWFYTLHALGTLLFDTYAYKSVVVGGLLVDEKGEKMSKSKGNTLNPFDVFDKIGVDAVRLQLCSSSPDNTKRFGYELVKENVFPFMTTLWNVCVFANNRAGSEGVTKLRAEDKWLISRTNTLLQKFTQEFEANNYHRCYEELKWFVVEDLSRWYIRLVRERTDDAVSDTLSYAIGIIAKLLAPYAPYMAEYIYLKLVRDEAKSVHHCAWPQVEKIDADLEKKMSTARAIGQAILSLREKINRGIRWPIKQAVIAAEDQLAGEVIAQLGPLIVHQTNVKKLTVQKEFTEAKVKIKPDYAKLGPVYGEATPKIIAHFTMKGHDAILKRLAEDGHYDMGIDGKQYRLERDHFIFTTELPDKYDSADFGMGAVYIDKELTPEMEAEGLSRELIRLIQQSRKEKSLEKTDAVSIIVRADPETKQKLQPHCLQIKSRVGAKQLEITDAPQESANLELVKVHTIRNRKFEVFFAKTTFL
ncbi:isoleucine--tRNA ligase [Candidatus Woesearchaeota archaeon]|nr:isoleucine--tRNA ligase [Candidatus Woesearchaeota archaeon]